MKHDLFISYSRADIAVVEPFVRRIESETGVKCWIDWNGIESGSQFEEKIISAIDEVDVVLFILSESAMMSPYVKMEINYAYNTQKRVVPVVVDGGKLRGWFLFKFGAIDFIDISQPRQVEKLLRDIREWCNKTPQPALSHTSTPIPAPAPAPATTSASKQTKTYKVGDYYDDGVRQGVVIWVDDSGCHGKLISLHKSRELRWASKSEYALRRCAGATNLSDGEVNCALLMQIDGWKRRFPALAWCVEQGEGWYLPAIKEWEVLNNISTAKLVNDALIKLGADPLYTLDSSKCARVWLPSSSESDSDEKSIYQLMIDICGRVFRYNLYDGGRLKSYEYSVRAMARF